MSTACAQRIVMEPLDPSRTESGYLSIFLFVRQGRGGDSESTFQTSGGVLALVSAKQPAETLTEMEMLRLSNFNFIFYQTNYHGTAAATLRDNLLNNVKALIRREVRKAAAGNGAQADPRLPEMARWFRPPFVPVAELPLVKSLRNGDVIKDYGARLLKLTGGRSLYFRADQVVVRLLDNVLGMSPSNGRIFVAETSAATDAFPAVDPRAVVIQNVEYIKLAKFSFGSVGDIDIINGGPGPNFFGMGLGFWHGLSLGGPDNEIGHDHQRQFFHPLFAPTAKPESWQGIFHFNPAAPTTGRYTGPIESFGQEFGRRVYVSKMETALRTVEGEKIYLKLVDRNSFFQLTCNGNGEFYQTPVASFTVTVGNGEVGSALLQVGLNSTETLEIGDGDILRFTVDDSPTAVLKPNANGELVAAGDKNRTAPTAWVKLKPTADRLWRLYSPELPLYTVFPQRADGIAEVHAVASRIIPRNSESPPFPLLPLGALRLAGRRSGAEVRRYLDFEARYAGPARRAALMAGAAQSGGRLEREVAVTRNGWVATFENAALKSLVIAEQNNAEVRVSLAFRPRGGALPLPLQTALFSGNCFLVASIETAALKDVWLAEATLDGLGFDLRLPSASRRAGAGDTTLIIKFGIGSIKQRVAEPSTWARYGDFNDAASDPGGAALSGWLQDYIAAAEADLRSGQTALADFVAAVTDVEWNGVLVLDVPLLQSSEATAFASPAVKALCGTVDAKRIRAHHLGCRVGGLAGSGAQVEPDSQIFAMLRYVDSEFYRLGNTTGPMFFTSKGECNSRIAALDLVVRKSSVTDFHFTLLLLIDRMFGHRMAGSTYGRQPPPTNAVILNGTLQEHEGIKKIVLSEDRSITRAFYPVAGAIQGLVIDDVEVRDEPAAFVLSGWLWLAGGVVDIGSFEAVAFSGLMLTPAADPPLQQDYSLFRFSGAPARRLADGEAPGRASALQHTLYRQRSLADQFPLEIRRLRQGARDQSPGGLGYRPLAVEAEEAAPAKWDADWFGIEFSLPLGGSGNAPLDASLLLAWAAETPESPQADIPVTPWIRIDGAGGASLTFEVGGILQLGAHGVRLRRDEETGTFTLALTSLGVTLLGMTFPPKGTMRVDISAIPGSTDRRLAWLGAYLKEGGL